MTGGLPYHGGPGSNYDHPCPGRDDRGAPRRPRLARTGQRGRHAHDQPRRVALVDDAGTVSPPVETGATPTARAGHRPRRRPGRVATFSTIYGREGPEWTALICDLPDGSRCYARLEEPSADDVDLAGEEVTLVAGEKGANTARR